MEDRIIKFIREAQDPVIYGMVQLTIKKHDGLITSVDVNKTSVFKVKDNVEALAAAGTLIKGVSKQIVDETQRPDPNYTPPNLTFTAMFHKDGQVDRIHVNDFKRKTFKK